MKATISYNSNDMTAAIITCEFLAHDNDIHGIHIYKAHKDYAVLYPNAKISIHDFVDRIERLLKFFDRKKIQIISTAINL